ncbi:MAG: Hsp20/alpha crystallin family protein [Lachnospiraceae bacterium]|jgi:HSP20 family protein|nr:Hsp20/alpha crystallin family protein [Lachnospiraceae bacterium]
MLRTFDLFDEMFRDPFFSRSYDNNVAQVMKTDVKEDANTYTLDIELPGYAREDIQAELKEGYLTISANRTDNKEEKDEKGRYIRKERYTGTCKRTFYVGDHLEQEDIKAGFKDGILRLVVPKETQKKIEDKPKLIEIQ